MVFAGEVLTACTHARIDTRVSSNSYNASIPSINKQVDGTSSGEGVCIHLIEKTDTPDDEHFCLSNCRSPNPCPSLLIAASDWTPELRRLIKTKTLLWDLEQILLHCSQFQFTQ